MGQLVDAFNQTAARLHEYEIARQEFAADVSHELHALASAMETAAQALNGAPTASRPCATGWCQGWSATRARLGRLADDLLELARLEGGRLVIEQRPVPLADVARQAVDEWAAEASQREVRLELAAHDEPIVDGDHERLVQACGNLIENALKHTPRDGRVRCGSGARTAIAVTGSRTGTTSKSTTPGGASRPRSYRSSSTASTGSRGVPAAARLAWALVWPSWIGSFRRTTAASP